MYLHYNGSEVIPFDGDTITPDGAYIHIGYDNDSDRECNLYTVRIDNQEWDSIILFCAFGNPEWVGNNVYSLANNYSFTNTSICDYLNSIDIVPDDIINNYNTETMQSVLREIFIRIDEAKKLEKETNDVLRSTLRTILGLVQKHKRAE